VRELLKTDLVILSLWYDQKKPGIKCKIIKSISTFKKTPGW
jgi:hypothetical protein